MPEVFQSVAIAGDKSGVVVMTNRKVYILSLKECLPEYPDHYLVQCETLVRPVPLSDLLGPGDPTVSDPTGAIHG